MRDSQANPTVNSMDTDVHRLRTGIAFAVAGTALFGLKSIIIKLAYREGVDATTLLSMRLMIALPFYCAMLCWLFLKENKVLPSVKTLLAVGMLGFIGHYLSAYLDMEGLRFVSAQLERLTLYTFPLMTTLLGWLLLKERIDKHIILALALTYSGVLLLYWFEVGTVGADATTGVLLVLAAALSFSCYVVLSKVYISRMGSRLFTTLSMLASIAFMMLHFGVTRDVSDLNQGSAVWGYGFLLAFFCTVIPSFMMAEAVARIGPSRSSIVGTAGPIFTIALAVILLDEPLGWTHFGGMVLVILGVSMLGRR